MCRHIYISFRSYRRINLEKKRVKTCYPLIFLSRSLLSLAETAASDCHIITGRQCCRYATSSYQRAEGDNKLRDETDDVTPTTYVRTSTTTCTEHYRSPECHAGSWLQEMGLLQISTVVDSLLTITVRISYVHKSCLRNNVNLKCGPMPNVMAALSHIGGVLSSTPQSLADAHYWSAVQ